MPIFFDISLFCSYLLVFVFYFLFISLVVFGKIPDLGIFMILDVWF